MCDIVTNDIDLITETRVQSVISKLPASPSLEVAMRVLKIKSPSITLKDLFGTCLSYNRVDLSMAVDIFLMMITIWEGNSILT